MRLTITFLNRLEYLEELLSAFLEIGVSGATVLDSVGMGHIISESLPIFAGLRDIFAGSSPRNKVILAIVHDEMVEKIAQVVNEVCYDPDESHTGFVISLMIDEIFGLKI